MTTIIDTGIPEDVKFKIIGIINILFPDCKIYLYGSRARGRFSHGSDADIAIDCGQPADRMVVFEAQELLSALITPLQINIVDVHKLPEEYKKSIERDRIIWKS
jgi:predicted nucleotidyltransferase